MSERAWDLVGLRRSDSRGPALSIVHKLAGAMTLPLLAVVVVVLAFEVRDIERESSAVRRQTALAVSADGPSRLLIGLQDEQAWAIVELVGLDAQADLIVEGYEETRRRTDTALGGFERLLGDSPEETRRAFTPTAAGLAASSTPPARASPRSSTSRSPSRAARARRQRRSPARHRQVTSAGHRPGAHPPSDSARSGQLRTARAACASSAPAMSPSGARTTA
jgi:hypothetical protein